MRFRLRQARGVQVILAGLLAFFLTTPVLAWESSYCGHGISNLNSYQRVRYYSGWNDPQPGVIYHFHRYSHEDWEYIGPSTWGWAFDHFQDRVCGKH